MILYAECNDDDQIMMIIGFQMPLDLDYNCPDQCSDPKVSIDY